MDISLISGAVASINMAKEIGKSAIGLRDFNEMAGKISAMNAELLKAQDSLFAHNAQLLSLQQELFQLRRDLDTANAALAEKGRYELFEVCEGGFVYRSAEDANTSPEHFICQPCFDGPEKRKVVLKHNKEMKWHVAGWTCPICKHFVRDR
ncbi:hypothetical protein DF053_08710 [Burkholderia cepacia]|uniref:hypothetical protein n=1 Tax=Burkholderia cepacia TaxID=292 RepID=UPI000F5F6042|nr:hypothetical protein [Burkholderia cepacia]RQZ89916.1 hypothetical protein DF053_08710 [Burkholderia cepacia]